jgi:hypothetical protein
LDTACRCMQRVLHQRLDQNVRVFLFIVERYLPASVAYLIVDDPQVKDLQHCLHVLYLFAPLQDVDHAADQGQQPAKDISPQAGQYLAVDPFIGCR